MIKEIRNKLDYSFMLLIGVLGILMIMTSRSKTCSEKKKKILTSFPIHSTAGNTAGHVKSLVGTWSHGDRVKETAEQIPQ